MAKPSAFRVLTVLSNIERKKLLSYLETRFFSNRKELAPLQKAWQRMQGKPLDEEKLFRAALPKKRFRKRDWYLLLSRLQEATEQFLGIQVYRQDRRQQQLNTLKAYRQLQLPVFFERSLRQARKVRAKEKRAEAELLLWDYQTELAYFNYIANPKPGEVTNLQRVTDCLDHYFVAEKLRQACLAHGRLLVNQETYHIRYLDAILKDLETRPELFRVPAIVLYATCYQAVVMGGSEQDLQRLRKVLVLYHERFPAREIQAVYRLAINYCRQQMNAGNHAFLAETRAFYENSLRGGFLLENDQLPPEAYTNIVSLGLNTAHYEQVATFIKAYTSELPGPVRESVANYNLARLFHAQEAYEAALKATAAVDSKDPFLRVEVEKLKIRIFVDLAEWEEVEERSAQLLQYLQGRAELGQSGEDSLRFLYFCRRWQLLASDDQEAALNLRVEIEEAPHFAEKSWLLGRLGGELE